MNAASAMSIWVVASLLIIIQLQAPGTDSFSAVYRHSGSGRKLFGGYRIVPKSCTAAGTDAKRSSPKTGICMFNYECTQHGGEMMGSCVDGFLFGACCALPPSVSNLLFDADYMTHLESDSNKLHPSSAEPSLSYNYVSSTTQKTSTSVGSQQTAATATKGDVLYNVFSASEDPDEIFSSFLSGKPPQYAQAQTQQKPILQQYLNNDNQGGFIDNYGYLPVHKYPVADTVLLNPDGTAVVDESDPQLLFTKPTYSMISTSSSSHKSKPTTEKYKVPTAKPVSYGSFVGGTYGSYVLKPQVGQVTSNNKIQVTIEGNHNAGYWQHSSERPVTTSRRPATETHKTTKTTSSHRPTERYPTIVPHGGYTALDNNIHILQIHSTTDRTAKPTPGPTKATTAKVTNKKPESTTMDNDRYPGYHYGSYGGVSKPSVIINNAVSFDGSGQAINHILGILNATHGKPTTIPVEQLITSGNGGLSTWVSLTQNGNKVTSTKYGAVSTKRPPGTSAQGPGYGASQNQNKPVPTVIVISPPSTDASPGAHRPKPSRKPVVVSSTKRPVSVVYGPPATTSRYPDTVQILPTGQESFISFPPVRNPDLNVSGLNQMEKPTIVHTAGYPIPGGVISSIDILPDGDDLNAIDPDEDYSDFTTPAMEDESVNVKIHDFVEKIVNSLAGNFQDLEGLLIRNENKTKLPNQNGIELSNVHIGDTFADDAGQAPANRPTTTKKPVRRPTTKPTTDEEYDIVTEPTTNVPTKRPRPTTRPPQISFTTAVPSALTTKRPLATTKRPTVPTVTTRRPSTSVTTRKPTSSTATGASVTTRRPTTKRPKPSTTTRRPRPTTTTTETVTEPPSTQVPDVVEQPTSDFRRECGVRPLVKKGGRIVGGKGSHFGHYPWQVLVRESTWLGLFTKNKCGGVLITHKYVITAAHCQPGFLASLVAVFGEFDISGELESKRSVTKNVRRVIVHRQYDPATFENDLALLELDSPIAYDEHIVPICMPREGEDYTGRMATVTGWGRLKYGGGVPSVLQEVRVPLIDNGVCQEMFQTAGHQKRIISSFLCAGYANGQKDSCEGDSGGPLMVEREDGHWVLLGTVSHGIKCAAPYLPGVYMRTTYYKPWLKSITGVTS